MVSRVTVLIIRSNTLLCLSRKKAQYALRESTFSLGYKFCIDIVTPRAAAPCPNAEGRHHPLHSEIFGTRRRNRADVLVRRVRSETKVANAIASIAPETTGCECPGKSVGTELEPGTPRIHSTVAIIHMRMK